MIKLGTANGIRTHEHLRDWTLNPAPLTWLGNSRKRCNQSHAVVVFNRVRKARSPLALELSLPSFLPASSAVASTPRPRALGFARQPAWGPFRAFSFAAGAFFDRQIRLYLASLCLRQELSFSHLNFAPSRYALDLARSHVRRPQALSCHEALRRSAAIASSLIDDQCAAVRADQGCGPAGNLAARSLSRLICRKLISMRLGKPCRARKLCAKMLRVGVCVVYMARPTQPLKAWMSAPVRGYY